MVARFVIELHRGIYRLRDPTDRDVREQFILADTPRQGGLRSRYRLRKQTVEPVFGVISFVWIFQSTGLRILTT
jgi:hypothetical protein